MAMNVFSGLSGVGIEDMEWILANLQDTYKNGFEDGTRSTTVAPNETGDQSPSPHKTI